MHVNTSAHRYASIPVSLFALSCCRSTDESAACLTLAIELSVCPPYSHSLQSLVILEDSSFILILLLNYHSLVDLISVFEEKVSLCCLFFPFPHLSLLKKKILEFKKIKQFGPLTPANLCYMKHFRGVGMKLKDF